MNHRLFPQITPGQYCLAALCALLLAPLAAAGTIRSCKYAPGAQGFGYGAETRFNRSISMTVEAWVYRTSDGTNQAILDHDKLHSHWFGFDPELTFYRSGGSRAVATSTVRKNQWTHVAASYDGTTVRFYIDGEPAGARSLANTAANHRDVIVVGKRFVGSLDEVRLWSGVRSQAQIRDNLEVELREGTGLEAVWAEGGPEETLAMIGGNPLAGGGEEEVFGMLPRSLTVPVTAASLNLDGRVSSVEYAGAEQLVLRYRDGNRAVTDAVAYLVRNSQYLYVGVTGARDPGEDLWQSKFEVYIDSSGNGSFPLNPSQISGGLKLSNGNAEFRRGHQPFNPFTGEGGFGWDSNATSSHFAAAQSTTSSLNEFVRPDMEFRFAVSLLGGSFDIDRLGIGHRHPGSADYGHRYAPENATDLTPGFWAEMRYQGSVERLPKVYLPVEVTDAADRGVADVEIFLTDADGVLSTRRSWSDGEAGFYQVRFNPERSITLGMRLPPYSRALPPVIFGEGIEPTLVTPTTVKFPPCPEPNAANNCIYQKVEFRIELPPPPVALGAFTPLQTWPTTQVRGGRNPRWIAPGIVELRGQNLHDQVRFYLVRTGCPTDPISAQQCVEGRDYHPISEVTIMGTTIAKLTVPDLNEFQQGSYRIAAHDFWERPGNVPNAPSSWKYAASSLTVGPPPFPMVHGFKFKNWGGGGSWEEMTDVYGFNMFADPLVTCAPWPHYLLWFPIYLELAGGDGSCVGISATSRLLEKGHYNNLLQVWDPDAIFANGHFTGGARQVTSNSSGNTFTIEYPPVPDRWTFDPPCRFAATNLWGEICRNHGVQVSSEMISSALPQMFGSGSGAERVWSEDGEPIAVFNRVANDPASFVVCMNPVAGGGHCVTPFKVSYGEQLVRNAEGWASGTQTVPNPDFNLIHVYDNNAPDRVSYIEIDLVNDRFLFPNLQDDGDPDDPDDSRQHYQGRAISAHPISIWEADHVSMPSLDVAEYIHLLIFGSAATGVHTDAKGGEWGWRNGERVDSIPGVKALPTYSGPAGDALHTHAFIPAGTELASSTLGVRESGKSYGLYAAHRGVQLRLRVPEAHVRQADEVTLLQSTGRLGKSLDGFVTRALLPRPGSDIAVGYLARKQASVTFTLTGLDLEGEASYLTELIGEDGRNPNPGIRFQNEGKLALSPDLTVNLADRAAQAYGGATFPELEIPANATVSFTLPHWPAFDAVQFELDLKSDGIVDERSVLRLGTPELQIERVKNQIAVRYPVDFSGWVLESSLDLNGRWSAANPVHLIHDENSVTAHFDPDEETQFFRLRLP